MKRLLPLLLLVLICGCDKSENEPAPGLNEADNYIEEILKVMEKNSINRKTIDWKDFKGKVRDRAKGSIVISDTYPAIKVALIELGDNHSFYQGTNINLSGSTVVCKGGADFVSSTDNIGYVKVGSFSGNATQATEFATAIQNTIKAQDKADLKGWIVDLRGNGGGNMWPMISGLGPILGQGILGYFIDPDNVEIPWEYIDGQARNNGFANSSVANPYTLINSNPKVAVLINQAVASSGEATAIAFIGRANTKSFGVSTCGLSTANAGYPLSDKAMLYLTVSVMADRNKGKKGGPILPDVTVTNDNEVVAKAVEWLNQP